MSAGSTFKYLRHLSRTKNMKKVNDDHVKAMEMENNMKVKRNS